MAWKSYLYDAPKNKGRLTITSVEKNVQSLEIEKGKLQQIKTGEVDVKKWRKNNEIIERDWWYWKSH